MVENAFCNGLEIVFETWEKSGARLGLKISDDAIKNDILVGNVVIGPEADNVEAVKIFHSIWGKPNCKLRRFQVRGERFTNRPVEFTFNNFGLSHRMGKSKNLWRYQMTLAQVISLFQS